VTLIEGIIGSIIATIIVAISVAWYRYVFGQRIKILDPQMNGFLAPFEKRNGVGAHAVHGTLKHLPKDHRVWLLVMNEGASKIWPQSFAPVEYSKEQGTWQGWITAFGWTNITIVAVVAPPTTQEYFNYFQRAGPKTSFEPILAIQYECKYRDRVQAKVPNV
jgi:hypothetical protein